MGEPGRGRGKRLLEVSLLVAAALFFAAYAVPILDPDLSPGARRAWWAVTAATWAVFVADYAVRLVRAPDRRRFVAAHPLDLAVLALPMLRPLKLVQQLGASTVFGGRLRLRFQGRMAAYAAGATLLLGLTAALAVLKAERGAPGANIVSFGDALWWAASTVSSTGYGDTYPVTVRGRVIATGVMFGGVVLLGVVAASFSATFIDRFQRPPEPAGDEAGGPVPRG